MYTYWLYDSDYSHFITIVPVISCYNRIPWYVHTFLIVFDTILNFLKFYNFLYRYDRRRSSAQMKLIIDNINNNNEQKALLWPPGPDPVNQTSTPSLQVKYLQGHPVLVTNRLYCYICQFCIAPLSGILFPFSSSDPASLFVLSFLPSILSCLLKPTCL